MVATEWFDDNVGEDEYDDTIDIEIMEAYDNVKKEVNKLKDTPLWADAMIFTYYFESNESLNDLAKRLKVSKSTVFLSVKRIKTHLKEIINNPLK